MLPLAQYVATFSGLSSMGPAHPANQIQCPGRKHLRQIPGY